VTDSQPSMPARFELPARALSGIVMGAAAVGALAEGGILFAAFVAIAAIAALREWHRLVNGGRFAREMLPTSLAIVVAVSLLRLDAGLGIAVTAILLGAGGAALVSAFRTGAQRWPIPWHAFGALYIGLPVLALMLLRDAPRGAAIVGGLFVAVWTTDTGALLFGRLIGGPKLAPLLSPNKTWAGFVGGTISAALAEAIYVGIVGGSVARAVILGILLALASHCGDLFESWVKRQFRAKNTGSLIPGHGGMLDRIDSVLFAAPACAGLLVFSGLNPFGIGS
jgi:phosphatidate cytidylyltransferase